MSYHPDADGRRDAAVRGAIGTMTPNGTDATDRHRLVLTCLFAAAILFVGTADVTAQPHRSNASVSLGGDAVAASDQYVYARPGAPLTVAVAVDPAVDATRVCLARETLGNRTTRIDCRSLDGASGDRVAFRGRAGSLLGGSIARFTATVWAGPNASDRVAHARTRPVVPLHEGLEPPARSSDRPRSAEAAVRQGDAGAAGAQSVPGDG